MQKYYVYKFFVGVGSVERFNKYKQFSRKMDRITIGIPAYNEGKTIGSTIKSILAQKELTHKPEIIICANGCTDNTEEVVYQLSKEHKNIRLIESERGKPNAWNLIRSKAEENEIFFTDADTYFSKKAVSLMQKKLKGNDVIAVGCNPSPIMNNTPFLLRPSYIPKEKAILRSIWGGGYIFNNELLQFRLEQYGFNKMPKDIINEDRWIALIIGQENLIHEENARIYYKYVTSIKDYLRSTVRIISGRYQIEQEYPELEYQLSAKLKFAKKWTDRAIKWKHLSPKGKVIAPINFITKAPLRKLLKIYCDLQAKHLYNTDSHTNHWPVTETSKVDITNFLA